MNEELRLLPWTNADGNPCYLSAAPADSPVSRLADDMERIQLAMGSELLGYAKGLSECPVELRFLAARLCEALADALRVAESRGARLEHRAPEGRTPS